MNIRYELRRNNISSDKKKPIIITVSSKGKRVRCSLGIWIDEKEWKGKDGQLVKAERNRSTQQTLDGIQKDLEDWYREYVYIQQDEPSKKEIKEKISEVALRLVNGVEKSTEENYILDHFDDFIADNQRAGKADKTLEKYRTVRRFISEVNADVQIEKMDAETYGKSFARYLTEVRGNENKSANKAIKTLKRFLNWAYEEKRIEKKIADDIRLLPEKEQEIIALEPDEIKTLEEATDLGDRLERVRDLFLLGVYTGFRYADVQSIRPINIQGDEIQIVTAKDKEVQKNPLQQEAIDLLEKYEYHPPQYSNQKFNDYLKELFTLLGLNRPIHFIYYYGDKKETEIYPLNEVIASHIARKSFVTDLLRRGVNPEIVRDLSGHKDIKAFQRYIKFSTQDKRNALQMPRV